MDRILIVHEDTNYLKKLREILSREGFDLFTAPDVETASRMCQHFNIKLVMGDPVNFNFYQARSGKKKEIIIKGGTDDDNRKE